MLLKAAIIALVPVLATAQTCADDASFTFDTINTGNTVDCDWLTLNNPEIRIPKYCDTDPSIKAACCISCNSLIPCEDTSGFTFELDFSGDTVGCDFFTKKRTELRTGNYCVESGDFFDADIAEGCFASCGLCEGGASPSSSPTGEPNPSPTDNPTSSDSTPSATPTRPPSPMPSPYPTLRPTNEPSDTPSENPSDQPSDAPSTVPSDAPSQVPSAFSSHAPSQVPSDQPSDAPSQHPSDQPSTAPSSMPSDKPSNSPSDQPSLEPSGLPSDSPTNNPSSEPSISPTNNPTASVKPSASPSAAPVKPPSIPTPAPVKAPTVPTPAPVKSPTTTAPTPCPADPSSFAFTVAASGNTQGCDWFKFRNTSIRRGNYCVESGEFFDQNIADNCASGCFCGCPADPSSFTFTVAASGNTQGCDWFKRRNTDNRRGNYCVESGEFFDQNIADNCDSGCFCE
eukprot:scaffold179_cov229-Chaetoceros_neogracile.AAC.4